MPIIAPGRLGIFSETELAEAEELGRIDFLVRMGVGAARKGKFRSIVDKDVRRRVAKNLAAMAEQEFNDAWERGHVKFLADAWGCQPDYLRRLRTQPYRAGPGWRRPRKQPRVQAMHMGDCVDKMLKAVGQFDRAANHVAVEVLNSALQPPDCLGGVFLPRGYREQFDFMFVAEMPAMSEPNDESTRHNFNFDVTERDQFLQEMMIKYCVAGSYVTDIVKQRDIPRTPNKQEIERWLPFLLAEIRLIGPRAIIVLGRRTYDHSFKPFVMNHVPDGIRVEWVFHYCSQVTRPKFEQRFCQVTSELRQTYGLTS